MKKTTTLILGFFLSFALTAQINPIKISKQLDKAEKNKVIRSGDEALSNLMVNPNPYTFYTGNSKNTTEVDIGWTSYDLQTNNSVQNRILVHDDGTMSAVWTMSAELNLYDDRGTGYNFYDDFWSVLFLILPTNPRLESSRTGWPSL